MFGKRADGVRVKKVDPFMKIIPYIMKTRVDSQVFFEDSVDINNVSNYIKKVKEEKEINLSYMTVITCALGRILLERPQINRFIRNCRLYQRNGVEICFAIKKQLTDEGEETTIKLPIYETDTIFDVHKRMSELIEKNKQAEVKNFVNKIANLLMSFPNWIIKLFIGLITWFDDNEIMPKSLIKVSPFHASAFVTNVGSLGIHSIYHHIYEFGTISIFLAMGRKYEKVTSDGPKKYITLKAVTDERICDGKYYAGSFNLLMKYINKPELMELSYEKIKENELKKKQEQEEKEKENIYAD